MRKPDRVKNVDTPNMPPGTKVKPWWYSSIAATATPRIPSSPGTYRPAGRGCAALVPAGSTRAGSTWATSTTTSTGRASASAVPSSVPVSARGSRLTGSVVVIQAPP
jgi:hypothetical protein